MSDLKLRGWLHSQTISEIKWNKNEEIVNLSMLPSAFAAKHITRGYRYVDNVSIAVNVPKGAMFKLFRREKSRVLVYILETNSMIWLPGGDVL